jgi:hypothetical protein
VHDTPDDPDDPQPVGDLDAGLRQRLRAALGGGDVSRAELLELGEALSRQGQEVARALAELGRREQEAARVQAEVERTLHDAGEALDDRDARLGALAAELAQERVRLTRRAGDLDTAEAELGRRLAGVEAAAGDLERVRGRFVRLEEAAAKVEEQIAEGRTRLGEALRLLTDRARHVGALERSLEEAGRRFEAVQKRLEAAERAPAPEEAGSPAVAAEERLSAVERMLAGLGERLARVEAKFHARSSDVVQAEAEPEPPAEPEPLAAEGAVVEDDRLARAAELAAQLLRVLGGAPEDVGAVARPAQVVDGHVLFVQTSGGYRLVQRDGGPPAVGERVAIDELGGSEALVTGTRRSPLPGDARPCLACVS